MRTETMTLPPEPGVQRRKSSSVGRQVAPLAPPQDRRPLPGPSPSALRQFASKLEKHKARLKNELGGFKRRISSKEEDCPDSEEQMGRPTLVSLEPLVHGGEERNSSTGVVYKACLRLESKDVEHEWQTDPFTLDDLVAVVVNTRQAYAKSWCADGRRPFATGSTSQESDGGKGHIVAYLSRRAGCAALWVLPVFPTWALARLLRPWAHEIHLALRPDAAFNEQGVADWLAAVLAAALVVSLVAGLFAGFSEMAFLPAKVFLKLERRDETEQVRQQMNLLLRRRDCLHSMDVCNFLNLGMATYYGSSETQKEGRVFCQLRECNDGNFAPRSRRRGCSFLCVSFDCRWNCKRGRHNGLIERWLVLRKDGLALFSSIMDEDPSDMLFFDTCFSLFRDEDDHVLICGATWMLDLDFGESARAVGWCNAMTLTAQLSPRTREQRFGSFAPIRHPAASKPGDRHMLRRSLARFLVCGRVTYRKIAEAIMMAQHEIFVLGWWVCPHLHLVRGGDRLPGDADPRLSSLLRAAADRGVRVCVLVYHETKFSLPNDSEFAELELRGENLYVVRHRSRFDSNRLWSHHEKLVVVDQQLAFLGGIDLCFGRYDDAVHDLRDDAAQHRWAGQDYSNARTCDFTDIRTNADILDRAEQPRMPWQDLHCMLLGKPARDVARHCIERWNHAKSKRPNYARFPTAILRRKVAVCNDGMLTLARESSDESLWPPELGGWQECHAQVLRSVGRWSAGTRTESSVHTAYCDLIQEAERFVYIENQFFCSGMDGDERIGNRVVEAIYRRVVRAHGHKETFHVMIVLPLLPALDGAIAANAATPLHYVMHWQYRTLRGLRSRLEDAGVTMSRYVSIYGLRTHGVLSGAGVVTEQIYVHSKVMLVDDRWAVVGSANINDRSLQGLRDSEVNVVLRDVASEEVCAEGSRPHVGFSAALRRALFAQHLGCGPEDLESEGPFADPGSVSAVEAVRDTARLNTQLYEDAFGPLPSDRVRSWSDLAARRAAAEAALPMTGAEVSPCDGRRRARSSSSVPSRSSSSHPSSAGDTTYVPKGSVEDLAALEKVRGHLVEFPLDFLVEEDLAPPAVSLGNMVGDAFN